MFARPSPCFARSVRLRLERLEDRAVPATVNWTLAANGDFANPANWTVAGASTHRVPLATDDAVIPGQFSVTSSANQAVNSLTATNFQVLGGTFAITQPFAQTAGTTIVAAGATLQANFQLNGGTLAGSGAVIGSIAGAGAVSPGVGIGALTVTGNVTVGGAFVADVSYPAAPAAHLVNGGGLDVADELNLGRQFVTDFKGTNDLTITRLSGTVAPTYADDFPDFPGNNPGYLTSFLGSVADGTGNATVVGRLRLLRTSEEGAQSLRFDFAQPLTDSDRLVIADIGGSETVQVQAFVRNGTTYQQVGLSGWSEQSFTGQMGVLPDSRWATWNPTTGVFTGNAPMLNEPLNVLTPDQPIDRIIISKTGDGSSNHQGVQFFYGKTAGTHFDQLVVNGRVTLSGSLNLSLNTLIPVGQRYRLIDNVGAEAVVGAFTGLAEGATVVISGQTLTISYVGGTGNDVVLTRVAAPPLVTGVRVNGGASAQRSMVTSLQVTFNAAVTFAGDPAAAFALARVGGGTVNFTATASNATGVTVVTLTGFTGTAANGFGSLADGRYTLTALANQISDYGFQLDGNGNGAGGDNFVFADSGALTGNQLFRLFGDANGDRVVNAADLNLFRLFLGAATTDITFDFNRDGVINSADLNVFRINLGAGI